MSDEEMEEEDLLLFKTQIFKFHFSPAVTEKNKHLSYIFVETKVSCCIHWRGKQKYQITNAGEKSKIVTFATK